jgi:hypothetical protein
MTPRFAPAYCHECNDTVVLDLSFLHRKPDLPDDDSAWFLVVFGKAKPGDSFREVMRAAMVPRPNPADRPVLMSLGY